MGEDVKKGASKWWIAVVGCATPLLFCLLLSVVGGMLPKSPNALGASCPSDLRDVRLRCSGQVTDEDVYTWTVTTPGKYDLTVFAPAKKVAFDPGLMITDLTGAELANVSGGVGGNASTSVDVKPGTYKVRVYLADNFKVKGGYSYEFEIAESLGADKKKPTRRQAPPPIALEPAVSETPIEIDVKRLAAAYEENEVAADDKYKGRTLRVTGTVQAISKDFMGDVYLQLVSPNEFLPTQAFVEKSQRGVAAALKKGQRVLVTCTGDGMIVSSPILRNCAIAP